MPVLVRQHGAAVGLPAQRKQRLRRELQDRLLLLHRQRRARVVDAVVVQVGELGVARVAAEGFSARVRRRQPVRAARALRVHQIEGRARDRRARDVVDAAVVLAGGAAGGGEADGGAGARPVVVVVRDLDPVCAGACLRLFRSRRRRCNGALSPKPSADSRPIETGAHAGEAYASTDLYCILIRPSAKSVAWKDAVLPMQFVPVCHAGPCLCGPGSDVHSWSPDPWQKYGASSLQRAGVGTRACQDEAPAAIWQAVAPGDGDGVSELPRLGLRGDIDFTAVAEVQVGPVYEDRIVRLGVVGRDSRRLGVRALARVARLVAGEGDICGQPRLLRRGRDRMPWSFLSLQPFPLMNTSCSDRPDRK